MTAVTADLARLAEWSPAYVTARAARVLSGMLRRGFTTVRDVGGADYGLAQAIEEGYLEGPRLLFAGQALSQTGVQPLHMVDNSNPLCERIFGRFTSRMTGHRGQFIRKARQFLPGFHLRQADDCHFVGVFSLHHAHMVKHGTGGSG